MAFNRTDAADLLALKNEVLLDPTGRGYDVHANVNDLTDLLNDPDNNLTPATGADKLTPRNVLKALMPVSISSQDQFKIQLMYEGSSGFNDDISVFREDIIPLSPPIGNAIESIVRALSRAEILFAVIDANGTREPVTISQQDWFAARDS